jgi:hypothetical protein
MMNSAFLAAAFGRSSRSYQNCREFVGLLSQVRQSSFWDNPSFDKQLQPIGRLVQFLQAAFDLADELGDGP